MAEEGHPFTVLWAATALILSFCVTEGILEFVFETLKLF